MDTALTFRLATENDLVSIVKMLSDDPIGALRENSTVPLPVDYTNAFATITSDSHQELTVAELDSEITK